MPTCSTYHQFFYQAGIRLCCLLALLLQAVQSRSQTGACTGSLGDPIVQVNFGAGAGIGQPLSSTTSDLQYVSAGCPQDGYYSIVNSTGRCPAAGGNWHVLSDHTGNLNGYFMMVNASFQPNIFYVQTISGLCDNTSYQFAAWLVNICSMYGILPNVTFTIEKTDGTVLQSYNSGDIPITNPAKWQQYGFNFTTPVGVSTVLLRMRNNAPGGLGNDIALDDITFRPVGASVFVAVTDHPGSDIAICTNNSDPLQFTSSIESCYNSTAYQWQQSSDTGATWNSIPGATASIYSRPASAPGVYWYRVLVAPGVKIALSSCRTASEPVQIKVIGEPNPLLASQATLCENDTLQLNPGQFDSYRWQNGSTQPVFMVRTSGTYSVTAGNLCGTATASVTVVQASCAVLFPSAFTPDGNGHNDRFRALHAVHLIHYHLTVFNRWGQKVFETSDSDQGWDGTVNGHAADAGTYVWHCELQQGNAQSRVRYKGTLMLIR